MTITLDDVSFTHSGIGTERDRPHIDGISLTLHADEAAGLIGGSGAGKTTLLQLITGLEKPKRGRIFVDSQDIHSRDFSLGALRRRIGLVFQFPEEQLFEATVGEDVAFGPRQLGLDPEQVEFRVESALEKMRLPGAEFKHRPIHALSQGEKRRVAIAGVLAMQPEMLALDEPTAGLDPEAAAYLVHLLRALHTRHGCGLLIAGHDLEFLSDLVSRFIILEHGRVMSDFSIDDFHHHAGQLPAEIGLPRAWRIAQQLRRRGFPLPQNILTATALFAALARSDKKKN